MTRLATESPGSEAQRIQLAAAQF